MVKEKNNERLKREDVAIKIAEAPTSARELLMTMDDDH